MIPGNLQIQNPQPKIQNMNDGILIIDKPVDWTSHDVVGKLRKLLKIKRIGHTGTLDPFATGVLVMLVGQATRLARFLDQDQKEYEATVQFGFETETGDLTGSRIGDLGLRNEEMFEILNKTNWSEVFNDFRGEILQTPPMYSAKKIEGKKLYELARKGIEIERKPIPVTIHDLELLEEPLNPESQIRIRVACSAGTYIRTLAEDIGRKAGIPCHLSALRRTRAGKFSIEQAVTLENIENANFISMNEALSHLPEKKLDEMEIKRIRNGMKVSANFAQANVQTVKMTDAAENLLAIGFYDENENLIQPRIVFAN
jgi:tRNA pseudouridine55 synthase